MNKFRWRIWYGDETIFDARNGTAYEAPARNVQLITNANQDHGWYACRVNDYYWYRPETDSWMGGDIFGLFDYLIEPGVKRVLFGRTIADDVYDRIFSKALKDPDLPTKTGWRPDEQRL